MSVKQKMEAYWQNGTFNNLYLNLKDIEKVATAQKYGTREQLAILVERIRRIQKDLLATDQVALDATDNKDLQGDLGSFIDRIENFKEDIRKVYKDALYPFLLAVKNAEKGWAPTHMVCQVWDYFSWWSVANPQAEIDKEFPKKELES